MVFAFHYAARSDIGLGRYKNNQDSGYAGPHLLVVADGMGGAAGGDVASSTVIGELVPLDAEGPGPDSERDLQRAVIRANAAMADMVASDTSLQGMGSTCTAILRSGSRLLLAHVGDSRAYVHSDGELTQVTHDHTFVQRLIDTHQITEEEAERHPQRSVILRVVGHLENDDVDMLVATPLVGQRWLLCSDGLPRVVSAETIAETMAAGRSVEDTADELVQLALRAGGPDNITVIVADVVDPSSNPPLTPQVVGAAATARNRPTAARTGPAARAAALTAPEPVETTESAEEAVDDAASRPRRTRFITGGLIAVVLLALAVLGAQQWRAQQYYVGEHNGHVTIYQGLNTNIGPLELSKVFEESALPVDKLNEARQDSLRRGLSSAGTLEAAQATVSRLWGESTLCAPTPAPTATGSPSVQPAPTAPTALGSPSPTTGVAAPVGPSPTSSASIEAPTGGARPSECPSTP